MAAKIEGNRLGDVLKAEWNQNYNREKVTLLTGTAYKAGAVLGKITAGAATSAAKAGNTGNGAMGAVTVGAGAKVGDYKLTIVEPGTNLGSFIVEDPDGINVGSGVVASAFSGGGLSFTLADGATDFVAGDQFTITVAAGSGKYKLAPNTAADGSAVAAAVLLEDVDASAGDLPGLVVLRGPAIVAKGVLNYDASVDDATKKAAKLANLAAAGIIGLDSIL